MLSGHYEAIYGDMPRVGLAAAGGHVPIGRTGHTAARRIGRELGGLPEGGARQRAQGRAP